MPGPLADRIRPLSLDEVVGQKHLLGENMPLKNIAASGHIPNMIFYGPSGVGKTTVAGIIADGAGKRLHKLNGTNASTADIKAAVEETGTFAGMDGIILYLDEIQYLNKKQQQSLLEYIENGSVTLIASTTENPYFYIYNAVLSRSTVFEFKPVSPEDIRIAVDRAFKFLENELGQKIVLEDKVCEHIALSSGGDVRKAINAAELCALASPGKGEIKISLETARALSQKSSMRYDRDGDEHYDILSAFQKSIRGSDENAGLHYLARLLEAGDLISPCRRLLVIASEDIGLAYPQAALIVKSLVDSAMQLGLPEARIPLAQAVILLATAPKSNSAITAVDQAIADIRSGSFGDIPADLKDSHYPGADKLGHGNGYIYPHGHKNNYVKQQYLPDKLKDRVYYNYGANKTEAAARAYNERIKKEDPEKTESDK